MKYILIIALTLALATSQFLPKTKQQDSKLILSEMDKNNFGSTFLSAVQLHLAAQSPLDEITLALTQVVDELNTQQSQADDKNRTDEAGCQKIDNDLTSEIVDHREQIQYNKNQIQQHTDLLNADQANLDQTNTDIAENNKNRDEGTAQRAAEKTQYDANMKEYSEDIAVIEETSTILSHLKQGTSFVQVKTRYNNVIAQLKKGKSVFQPLVSALAQLATKIDQRSVEKVLALLGNLKSTFQEQITADTNQEEKRIADWTAYLADLDNEKNRLLTKKANLEDSIVQLHQAINNFQAQLDSHNLGLENAEVALQANIATWVRLTQIYQSESAERTRELEIISKLQDHLSKNLGSLTEFLQLRK